MNLLWFVGLMVFFIVVFKLLELFILLGYLCGECKG